MRLSKIPHPHRPHLPHHGKAIAIFVATLCLSISAAFAQPAKRALQHSDFDAWRSIATPILSRDGKWLAYSVQPQDGDGELVIRELASGKERRETVGALPPPPIAPEEENPDAPPVPRAIRVTFTSDSRFLVATTFASKADTDAARKGRKKPDDMPKGGLMLFNLVTNDVQRVANVKSVQVPTKGGAWLAYLKEEIKTTPPTANASAPKPGDDADDDQAAARRAAAPPAATTTNDDPAAPKFGTDLVLRDLMQNTERTFANVLESSFARDGKTLLFAVAAKAETDNGIYAITPQSDAAPVPLLVGKGKYLKTTWDREQTQAAFVSDRDDAAAKAPSFKLYHWPRGTPTAKEVVSAATLNFPAAMTISDKGNLAFSRDGKKLYLPVAPPAKPPRAANSGPTEEQKVVADLWRWNDDTVQPMQRIRAVQEKNRSYRGVLDLATMHYRQLADMGMRNVSMSDDGTRAVGSDDSAYRRLMDYDAAYADLYVVNTSSGEKKLALKKLQSNGNINQNQWSPDGNGLLYYQNKHWHVLNTTDGSTRNLSARFKVALHNEEIGRAHV